jgi:hypothetical protein
MVFPVIGLLVLSAYDELTQKPNAQTISDDIITPTLWTSDKEWIVDGIINVHSDLVIEPGTVVKFKHDSELSVGERAYGSLKALGTTEKPIVFTSAASNPAPGKFRGISFQENAASVSELAFCTIEYAGGTNGYHAALYIYNCSVSIRNCIVRKSATSGIVIDEGAFVDFRMNTISECKGYVMEVPAAVVHQIEGNSVFYGSGVLINDSAMRNLKVTWQALNVPYIASNIDIYGNAELTLSPALHILFLVDGCLSVGNGSCGKIVSQGTAEKPIVFSSAATFPAAGNWKGIELHSDSGQDSSFTYSIIEYAGNNNGYNASLYMKDSGVSISNSIIRYSAGKGIYLNNAWLMAFEHNIIESCNDFPIDVPASTAHKITENNLISGIGVFINDGQICNQIVTWNKLSLPYIIEYLDIKNYGELTLSPGVILLFKTSGYLEVGSLSHGKLVANGTESEPVIFDSASVSPLQGDWWGIGFFEFTINGSVLNHCKVMHGGNINGYSASVYSFGNSGNLTVTNSEIGSSSTYGMYVSDCNPVITNITFVNNNADYVMD